MRLRTRQEMGWPSWAALFLLLWGTHSSVWADSKDILSHFQVSITVQEEYNSNIDLTSKNKKDDFITTLSPGLKFSTLRRSPVTGAFRQAPTAEEKYGMELDFHPGFVFYAKEHEDNYVSLNGTLNAWYALTQRLQFRLRDNLIRSDEIRETDYSPSAIEGQYLLSRTMKRVPYLRNVFEPSLQYQFGQGDMVTINYQNNVYNIQGRTGEDSVENFVNPKVTYWFDIRNGISLEYGLTLGNFERSPDLTGHMAAGRYTYRFNPRTSIFGDYTQVWRDFESPGISYLIYRPSIGAEHAFSRTLSGRLQLGYYWEDPERGSSLAMPFYDILLTQRGRRTTYTLSFQGGYTEDYFDAENLGFAQYRRAIGRMTHQVLEKIAVGIFSSYEWAKYTESVAGGKKPKDQIWAVGGNASYQISRWLSASLDLTHRENHSNISDRDYSEYRGVLRITAQY
jgi:hypothetical protein